MGIRKQGMGSIAKKAALGVVFSSLASMAFAWSISGKVVDEAKAPIQGATVSTFNLGSLNTETDAQGAFTLSDNSTSIFGIDNQSKVSVQKLGNLMQLTNNTGSAMKVTLFNSLGKATFQNEFTESSIQIDLSKYGQQVMIMKIAALGGSENYVISGKGVAKSLKKDGDMLPMLQIAKDGFAKNTYQMTKEVETDVVITLKKPSANPTSSSSEAPIIKSSDSSPKSSSSAQLIVNCAGKTYEAGNHDMKITVDGKERTFIMRVPQAYKGDKPVPLVVDYHPIGGSSANHMNSSGYKTYSDAIGGISLYPQGTTKTMGPGWNVGPCCSNDDDIKFSREMIKMVEEKVCIDTKRVYAAGFSMGGGMSNHVACFMSDVFTAVAPAAMDLNTTNSAQCAPERAVPIIMFRGTNDNVCRYQGGDSGFNDGLNFLGAEKNFKFWADKNGCTGSPTTNKDGCQEYSNCKEGSKVVLCTKQGGGHDYGDASIGWPFLYSFEME